MIWFYLLVKKLGLLLHPHAEHIFHLKQTGHTTTVYYSDTSGIKNPCEKSQNLKQVLCLWYHLSIVLFETSKVYFRFKGNNNDELCRSVLTWRHAGGPTPQVPDEPTGRPAPSPWLRLADPPKGFQTPRQTAQGLRLATATAEGGAKKIFVGAKHSIHNAEITLRLWTQTWKPLPLNSSSNTFQVSSRASGLVSRAAGFLGPRDFFRFTLFLCNVTLTY